MLQYMHGILIEQRRRRQINIGLLRTNTSNKIIHTQRKAVSITTYDQSVSHHQAIHTYRLILITQTGHGVHTLAYTYVHDFTHASMHR